MLNFKEYVLQTIVEALNKFEEDWNDANEVLNLLVDDLSNAHANDTGYNLNKSVFTGVIENKVLSIKAKISDLNQVYVYSPSNTQTDKSFGGFNWKERVIYLNLYKFVNFSLENLMEETFDVLINTTIHMITKMPPQNAAIHHEIGHYLFAKGFKSMTDYQKHEKEDYEKLGDLSQEEFDNLIRELYVLWKSTHGRCFGEFSEEGLKQFFNTFQFGEPSYITNLKERAKLFGIDIVIKKISQFPIRYEMEEGLSEFIKSGLITSITLTEGNEFPSKSTMVEKKVDPVIQALADKIMGPGFIPLTWEDIMSTYNEAKKHGKYK